MRPPALTHASAAIFLGDCLDVLAEMPDNSVDSICTDPPYGLGFMGKAWDDLPPGLDWAVECLRVLKPGGHLLAFGGSRTWHRLAVAIEDAGFEMRDSIAWMYGSGFPKSMDVSKAIDKMRVEDREPTRVVCRAIRAAMDAEDLKSRDLVQHFEGCHPRLIDHWAARDTDSQPAMPKWGQWETLKQVLPALGADLDAEVWRLNGRKGTPGEAWDQREVVGERAGSIGRGNWREMEGREDQMPERFNVTAPATPAAQQWAGWGTALKPAFEPIVVARKPLNGTVAANVLEHGTGALNIDGCRVGNDVRVNNAGSASSLQRVSRVEHGYRDAVTTSVGEASTVTGRWPTNVVLDGDAAEELDEQSGERKAGNRPRVRNADENRTAYGEFGGQSDLAGERLDSGGASRFFPTFRYQAKAPTKERPVVTHDDGSKTSHATVKPLALMRWLVRLVTPAGGTVLDTFAGSGATIEAAVQEGFYAMGIEREEDYLQLIQVRLDRVTAPEDAA